MLSNRVIDQSRAAVAVLATSTAACLGCSIAPDEPDEEEPGAADQAALNPNALNPNALNPNALNPNALNPNALNPNALNPNALSPGAMSAIQNPGAAGELSRELLRYVVSCAFRSDQSFAFSWIDAGRVQHAEVYPGLLGLAPEWATQALGTTGQEWVSACLASRVNAEGISVMLSSRGTHPALATSAQELADYPIREAVFFGNLFTGTPKVHACYDPLSMLPSDFARRLCAQPQLLTLTVGDLSTGYDCGPIEVLGPCLHLLGLARVGFCDHESQAARYFYDCAPPGGDVTQSVTTFLQGP